MTFAYFATESRSGKASTCPASSDNQCQPPDRDRLSRWAAVEIVTHVGSARQRYMVRALLTLGGVIRIFPFEIAKISGRISPTMSRWRVRYFQCEIGTQSKIENFETAEGALKAWAELIIEALVPSD
jgi:hypothetical protein